MRLTKKDEPYRWESEKQLAIKTMVTAFENESIFQNPTHDQDVVMERDASNDVFAGVLLECDNDGVLHPVAYLSMTHTPAECNYDIYDKELMAIIGALEE